MKKILGLLLVIGVIATAFFALRPAKTTPTQATATPLEETPASPSLLSDTSAPESVPAVSLPVAKTATPAATITPATPLATTAAKPAAIAPTGPVTNRPKTLNELYRAFDAINAARETKTPETLASLVEFASTENADVRGAALNAIIDRNDVSAAPLLRKAAKQLDDSKAIIALLETADYIELPSITMAARPRKPKPEKPSETAPSTPPVAPPAPANP